MEAQQTAEYLQVLQVGMVIDLTNSSRYYSADSDGTSEFEYSTSDLLTVYHRKVLVFVNHSKKYQLQHPCSNVDWHADPLQGPRPSASA